MATSRYTIVKNNGDKIINYKSNFEKAQKAFEKLKSKYKNVKLQSYSCNKNHHVTYFETSHGNTWKLREEYCSFNLL